VTYLAHTDSIWCDQRIRFAIIASLKGITALQFFHVCLSLDYIKDSNLRINTESSCLISDPFNQVACGNFWQFMSTQRALGLVTCRAECPAAGYDARTAFYERGFHVFHMCIE
jgi:hypothetical protein